MATLKQQLASLIPPPPGVQPSRQPDIDFIGQRALNLMEAIALKCDLQSQITQNMIGAIAATTHLAYLTTLGVNLKPTGRVVGVEQTQKQADDVGKSNLIDQAMAEAGNFLHSRE